jgi:hypothetical protein
MTSVESLALLGDRFERVIRPMDLGFVIEHVRRLAPAVFARHFKGYRPQMLGRKRVTESLRFEVFEKRNEAVGDILVLIWNQRMRDLYAAMVEHVRTVNENVEEIERIPDEQANAFLDDLLVRFDRDDVLVCVRLNDVRFGPEVIARRLEGVEVAASEAASEPVGAPVAEAPEASPATEE